MVNRGEDILKFDDIVFSEHPVDKNGVGATVSLYNNDFEKNKQVGRDSLILSIVAGESFYSDSSAPYSTYEVMLLNNTGRDKKEIVDKYFDGNKLGNKFSLDADEPMGYVQKDEIINIIDSFKFSLDDNNNLSLKDISNDLLNIAFLDKDERATKLSDLNLLIHQDESLPKRERKLIHDIVKLIKDEAVGENIEKVETVEGLNDLLKDIKEDIHSGIEGFDDLQGELEDLENILNS